MFAVLDFLAWQPHYLFAGGVAQSDGNPGAFVRGAGTNLLAVAVPKGSEHAAFMSALETARNVRERHDLYTPGFLQTRSRGRLCGGVDAAGAALGRRENTSN